MKPTSGTHESLARDQEIVASSDRSFGFTFGGFFLLVGLWPLARGGSVRPWAIVASALFVAVALVRPAILAPLNRIWLRVGLLLHRVVNPVVMAVMFYGVITPFGLAMRATGWDPLRKRFDPLAQSYWIERRPPGPKPETMSNQF